MRALFLALALAAPPLAARPCSAAQAQEADRAAAAIADLERGLASQHASDRAAAVQRSGAVPDARVVALVRRALRDGSREVASQAVSALGYNAHVEALPALQRFYDERRKALRKDEQLLPLLLVAIGRHGSADSIRILLDDVRAQPTRAALEARILGLGNIRAPAAIDALFELVSRVGFVEMHLYSDEVRLALAMLTGVDKGRSFDAWRAWWNAAKAEFQMAPAAPRPPALDGASWERWCKFWGLDPETGSARG